MLPLSFSGLGDRTLRDFLVDLDIPESRWQELGAFRASSIKNIPVVPASDGDAQEWLARLQWEGVNSYATPEILKRNGMELLGLFPFHTPRPLEPSEMLDKAQAERGERSWFLLGPHDLGLWS